MSKARIAAAFALTLSVFGCSNGATIHHGVGGNGPTTGASGGGGTGGGSTSNGGGGGTTSNGGGTTSSGGGSGDIPGCVPGGPNDDEDMDHYTPAQGDCDDCNPLINPGAVNIPGDPTSYDCSGNNNPPAACDQSATNKNDATSIAQSMELCDSRFIKDAEIAYPPASTGALTKTDPNSARNVVTSFGVLTPHQGANMAMLSTGIAFNVPGVAYPSPQEGTAFSTTHANPLPSIIGAAGCGSGAEQDTVNDYTEVVFTLKAPTNVKSFSFDFQFFSAEYPEFVCSDYNDEFFAIIQSSKTYTTAQNISFDSKNNPVTINSGFFTVCSNWSGSTYTDNCNPSTPISTISGTGYDGKDPDPLDLGADIGGSTGWLTTTVPIMPAEDITLRFVIFDENDHIYDSAVLLDNFKWGTTAVTGPPVTIPITYRTKKTTHHKAMAPVVHESLMCGA